MEKVIQFLQDLAVNNSREWFVQNRKQYEESRDKILFLTEVLINEIGKFDKDVSQTHPKDCVFRIFRDVRFSNDKRPYKTNFGSFMAKGGRKSMQAGYYFHIEPEASFVGGGLYMPPSDKLKMVRNYLAEHGDEFLEIINKKEFKSVYPEMYDDRLKTAPKGFEKDHEFIGLLRYKSFAFTTRVENDVVTGEKFIEFTVKAFRQLYEANRFLNDALAEKT
jgi:uncharacterized protein (TIGR02453 family)